MKHFFSFGALLAALGVAAGAFGAHALKSQLTPDMLAVWETGARYHLVHALGLMIVGVAAERWPNKKMELGGWLLATGVLLFSGSLYALAVTGIRPLGAITPFGGVSWIIGWVLIGLAAQDREVS